MEQLKFDFTKEEQQKSFTEEFGEHIGGARKELYDNGVLSKKAIDEMNDAEREKLIKKTNIWKRPDYEELVSEQGVDKVVAFAIKKVYDAIPASPRIRYGYDVKEEQKAYVSFIYEVKRLIDDTSTVQELQTLPRRAIDVGIVTFSHSFASAGDIAGANLTNQLYRALCSYPKVIKSLERDMEKAQFLVDKDKKLPRGVEVKLTTEGDWIVVRGYRILSEGHGSKEDAIKAAQGLNKGSQKTGKRKFTPPQLEGLKRVGDDVIKGRTITGEDYLRDFNIRGGEFGNWMSEDDARENLKMAYEAFCDLAVALNIDSSAIGLDNRLSIAFGARGIGNAAAHYEPLREVINLTKMKGAGSLAHEYFHAIDDYLGKKANLKSMLTEANTCSMPESMRDVINAMTKRPLAEEEAKKAKANQIERAKSNLTHWLDYYCSGMKNGDPDRYEKLKEQVFKSLDEKHGDLIFPIDGMEDPLVTWISNQHKDYTGHVIKKDDRRQLFHSLRAYLTAIMADYSNSFTDSDYLKASKAMDKCTQKEKHGYWSSICEMFARAGACFVTDELAAMGRKNDYLSGHSECAVGFDDKGNVIKAYPLGEERENINRAIRKMLDELLLKPYPAKSEVRMSAIKEILDKIA